MKQIPKIALAITILVSSVTLTELFLTLPSSAQGEQSGQVLGIFKTIRKKTQKIKKKITPKKNTSKKTSPAPAKAPPPATSAGEARPDYSRGGTPPLIPPPPASAGAAAGRQGEGTELASLEREITVVSQDGKIIGPDHYKRLKSELDKKAAAGADAAKIAKLREMLETVNPDQVKPTGSTAPQNQQPNCPDDQKPVLTADITDFSKIQSITAPGSPVDDQDKYKGHSFIWTNYQRVSVYAPVDAILDSVGYQADNESSPYQYVLGFKVKVNCNYGMKFDHIDEVIPAIQAVAPPPSIVNRSNTSSSTEAPKKISIEFKAGDLLGYTQGTRQAGNWDFGMYNTKEEGPLAKHDPFGLSRHALCWVDYFTAEKQGQYRALLDGNKLVCSY